MKMTKKRICAIGFLTIILAMLMFDVHNRRVAADAIDRVYIYISSDANAEPILSSILLTNARDKLERCVRRTTFLSAAPMRSAAASIGSQMTKQQLAHGNMLSLRLRDAPRKDFEEVNAKYAADVAEFKRELEYIRRTF